MAIETIGLVAVTENAAKKVAVKAGGKIKAQAGTKYLLQVENSDVAPENVTVKRVGKDLLVQFEGSEKPDLTIEDFFAEGMDGQLYGVAEDGQLYAYVRTDGEGFGGSLLLADGDTAPIALGGDSLGDGAAYLASTFDDAAGFVLWPWLLGLAGVGAAAAAIIHHNKDGGGHHTATSPAPTNAKIMDAVGPIQGELHNGDITDDSHPAISGNGVPGATIHIIDNGQEIGSTTVAPDGTWSFTPELADGPHAFDITQVVPGQNPSDKVHVIDIVVDTVAPAAPNAWLDPASDSGTKGDGITNDTKPTIDGKTEPRADVTVTFPTGETIHTKADENGNWSVTPTQPLPEGKNDITVIATDPAGNQSQPTILPVVIDTTPPSADSWLDPASDSGTKGDGITNDTKPTIDGKTEPRADVIVTFPTGETIHTKADENGNWSVTPTQPLPEGKNDITIIATDPAGNQSQPVVLPIVIDTTTPPADAWLDPASDSGIKGDGITNDTTPTIDGKTEPNSTVEVTFPTGEIVTTTADANGDWSVTPTQPLPEGKNDISVVVTDPAGNQSEPNVLPIEIDSIAPTAPTIDKIVDNDDPAHLIDVPKDGSTNDTTPVISGGGAEPGDIIHVIDNGTEIGTAVVDPEGNWSFEVPADKALDEGEHDFTVIAEDPAGNQSEPSQPYPIHIDTTAPAAPTINDVINDLDPAHPIHIDPNSPTNDNTPVISGGDAEPGDIIHVIDNGTEIGTTVVDPEGNWSFTPDTPMEDGPHDITVIAEDPAGNQSEPSQPYPIVIDTTAPTAPTIDSIVDNDDPAHLIDVPKDGSTNDTTPVISGGGAEPGDIIHVIDNGTEIGTTVVDPEGNWSFEVPADKALDEGEHDFTVIAEDPAGNQSEPSQPYPIHIDTTAPDAPSITGVVDNDDPAHLVDVPKDGSTNDTTPVINGGGAEKGDIIHVFDGETELGSTVVTSDDGTWSFEVPADKALDNGDHDFTAKAEDPAGNISEPSQPYPVNVNTLAPDAPSITGVVDNDDPAHLVDVPKNGDTNDTTPVINGGGAEKGDIIHVFDGETELGSTVVTSDDGTWSFEVPADKALDEGEHDFIVKAEDPAGNMSGPSEPYPINIDTTAPNAPTITGVVDNDDPAHLVDVPKNGDTNDTTPVINGGGAEKGDIIHVFDGETELGSTVVTNEDGTWSFEVPADKALDEGEHDFTVKAEDPAGNVSPASDAYPINIDTTAPSAPTITGVVDNDDPAHLVDVPKNGDTNDTTPVINGGGAEKGDIIHVFDGETELGSTVVTNDDGTWSFEVPADKALEEGEHDFTVKAEDPAGNISAASDAYPINIDTTAPSAPSITGVVDNDDPAHLVDVPKNGDTNDTTPVINGGGAEKGDIIHVFDGETELGSTVVTSDDGTWSFEVPADKSLDEGEHDFTVKAEDPAGNISPASDAYPINIDLTPPVATLAVRYQQAKTALNSLNQLMEIPTVRDNKRTLLDVLIAENEYYTHQIAASDTYYSAKTADLRIRAETSGLMAWLAPGSESAIR